MIVGYIAPLAQPMEVEKVCAVGRLGGARPRADEARPDDPGRGEREKFDP